MPHRRGWHRVFVLIHGTFAAGAPWTAPNSPLSGAIRAYDPSATIVPYRWSGDNLQEVREKEGQQLANWIRYHSQSSQEQCRYVLIAHSHGGNIATSLVSFSEAVKEVECIVSLATPFLEYRPAAEARFPLKYSFSAKMFSFFCFIGPQASLNRCIWTSGLSRLAYIIPALVVCAVLISLGLLAQLISKRRAKKRSALAAPLKESGPRTDSTSPVKPVLGSTIPTLVLTSHFDEPFFVLSLLSAVTDAVQWTIALLMIAAFVALFVLRGQANCADLASYLGLQQPFDWTVGVFLGVVFPIAGLIVMLLAILVGAIVEAVWILVVLIPVHLLRGSQGVSELLHPMGLSRFAQSGFGEKFPADNVPDYTR